MLSTPSPSWRKTPWPAPPGPRTYLLGAEEITGAVVVTGEASVFSCNQSSAPAALLKDATWGSRSAAFARMWVFHGGNARKLARALDHEIHEAPELSLPPDEGAVTFERHGLAGPPIDRPMDRAHGAEAHNLAKDKSVQGLRRGTFAHAGDLPNPGARAEGDLTPRADRRSIAAPIA